MRHRISLALLVITSLSGAALGADSRVDSLPAAAHLSGQNGSSFRSDVRVYSGSSAEATVQATVLASTDNSTAAPVSFVVPAGRATVFNDFIADLFHLEGGGGAVRFVSDLPARDHVESLFPGSFGQQHRRTFIAAAPESEASLRQTTHHVRDDAGHRVNLGVVNNVEPHGESDDRGLRSGRGGIAAKPSPGWAPRAG